tara:strand:- start:143 stop:367 length:225 start_codon:yes stop_codon:yes gene_type:complete
MIRIAWVDKRNEKVYYGEWQKNEKLEELLEWINTNNKLYNKTRYWLEKKENNKIKNILESEIVEIEKEYLEIVR